MKKLCPSKRHIGKMFIMGMVLALLSGISVKCVSAQETASYTIKRHKEVKKYGKIKTKYISDQPVLKGNSAAIKKINKSLEKEYQKTLEDKEKIQGTARDIIKAKAERKVTLYSTHQCSGAYNQGGIVSFWYYMEWYAAGVHNAYHYGLSYDLKTGRKLRLRDVVSGSTDQIKTKIWKQYRQEYPQCPLTKKGAMKIPLSHWHFYLKNGNVMISYGSYAPWAGNGETEITLSGMY